MSTHLDGNMLGGELGELFTVDITAATGRCASCGTVSAIAQTLNVITQVYIRRSKFSQAEPLSSRRWTRRRTRPGRATSSATTPISW